MDSNKKPNTTIILCTNNNQISMSIEDYLNPEHSIRKEVTLLLSLLGTVVSLISFIATDWAKPDTNADTNPVKEIGLWRVCRFVDPAERVREGCFPTHGLNLPEWFTVTQILCTIGFILQLITLFLVIISECVKGCRGNVTLIFTFVGTGLAAVIFMIPALVLFGEEVVTIPQRSVAPSDPHVSTISPIVHTYKIAWAFYLISAGIAVQPLCAILGIWEGVVQYKKKSREKTTYLEIPVDGHHPYGSIPKSNYNDV